MDLDAADMERDRKTGSRIIPFILVIAVCLVTGIALGSWTGGKTASPAEPKQAPINFVYLGYDTFQAPAKLNSVWVLKLNGNGGAEFRGISPALVITTAVGQPAVLRDFLADPYGAAARMPQITYIPQPSFVVAIDREGFFTMLNRTGGVQIDGNYLRGDELIAFLSQGGRDPIAILRQELRIVKSLFAPGPCPSESDTRGIEPGAPAFHPRAGCARRRMPEARTLPAGNGHFPDHGRRDSVAAAGWIDWIIACGIIIFHEEARWRIGRARRKILLICHPERSEVSVHAGKRCFAALSMTTLFKDYFYRIPPSVIFRKFPSASANSPAVTGR